jgi:GntR family transcriptional repressor for pyruvate dehydrogenase complex
VSAAHGRVGHPVFGGTGCRERLAITTRSAGLGDQTPHNVFEFETLDAAFHPAIARDGQSQTSDHSVVETRRKMWAPVGGIFWCPEEHAPRTSQPLVDAVQTHDPDLAARTLGAHIATTHRNVEGWLKR